MAWMVSMLDGPRSFVSCRSWRWKWFSDDGCKVVFSFECTEGWGDIPSRMVMWDAGIWYG